METFWEKVLSKSGKSKNPIVFYNQISTNFYSKDDGISIMVVRGPVEPQTGVRFSYTVLNPLGKRSRKGEKDG